MSDLLADPQGDPGPVGRSSIRGGLSFALARGSVDGLRFLSVLVLARLLTPSEFGVVAMVVAVVGVAEVLQDFGLSAASVQRPDLTGQQASTLMWINLSIAAVLMSVVLLLAPQIAVFVRVPDATGLTRLLAPTFLLSSIAAQHLAMLRRWLRFSTLARIRVTKAAVYTVVTVALAAAGFGRSSLVWGTLVAGAVESSLAVWLAPVRITRPRLEPAIREIGRLGGSLLGYSLLGYIASAFPLLAIGRSHGAAASGTFGRALRIVALSTGYLISPIGSVAFPVLSRLAPHPDRWRRYYYEVQALLAVPVLFMAPFLMLHAGVVVDVTLGPGWQEAAPVVAASAVTFLASLPCAPTSWLLVSLGRGDRLLKWGAFGWLAVGVGVVLGLPGGGSGVAIGVAAASVLLIWPCLAYSFRDTPLAVGGAIRACCGPLPAALCALAASWTAVRLVGTSSPFLELAVAGLTHGGVYAAVLLLTATERARARSVLEAVIRRRPEVAPA